MAVGVMEEKGSRQLGRGQGMGEWGFCTNPAASTSPQAVLAGAVAFIYEKRGGIYWVSWGRAGVSTRPRSWRLSQATRLAPSHVPPLGFPPPHL